MPLSTAQNNRKDSLSSSDVKIYGYHSYNINRKLAVTRQKFVVKSLIFMSLIGIWQIGIFSNSDGLKKNLRSETFEREYFTETVEKLIPKLEVSGMNNDSSNHTKMKGEIDDTESIDPSSILSSQTEADEKTEELNLRTLSPTTNSTVGKISSLSSTISSPDETASILSTTTSDKKTVETSAPLTNQTEETSLDGANSFTADPLVMNNEVVGPESTEIDSLTAAERLESSTTTTNTSLTAPSANADEPKPTDTLGGQINATSGTIFNTPSNTTADGNSSEEQQAALWEATKDEFYAIQPWKNESTFTTVDRGVYKQVVEKAHASVASLVEDVYTDCEMYILPALQTGDGGKERIRKPRVQFKCLRDDNPVLRDNLCHTVNMCKVVLDEEAWKEEVSLVDSGVNNTNTSIAHSSIFINKKSALLMMVDGIEYMMETDNFMATINKASYAYRSNRELFIWIGDLDKIELNRRETESLESTFDFKCVENTLWNSMHYYKPIAILVLFGILDSESIFFMDADADFSTLAFDRIKDDKKLKDVIQGEDLDLYIPIGPESYLDISSQASLVGTQNAKGKMLMNSGLFVLRNTQWSRDLAALWWYARCGRKDQLGLWLVLYATFSAWTTPGREGSPAATKDEIDESTPFAYSGKMFFEYSSAQNKVFMHFRKYGHKLQAAWKAVVEQQRPQSSGIEMDNIRNYDYPIPTNIKLYNGGSPTGIEPKLSAVMELPHVVILPQLPIYFNKTIEKAAEDGTSVTVQVNLPRFKATEGGNSFVSHSKSLSSCTAGRCWPYAKD